MNIDYRTTHYMRHAHPEAHKSTSAEVIAKHKAGYQIKNISLFPDDLIVVAIGDGSKAEIKRLQPAYLEMYKYIWDLAGKDGRYYLRRHLKRCKHIREQIKNKLISPEVMTWYMALVLGSATEG